MQIKVISHVFYANNLNVFLESNNSLRCAKNIITIIVPISHIATYYSTQLIDWRNNTHVLATYD